MTHLDTELKQLKTDLIEMWTLVINQLSKSREALAEFDKDLTSEVFALEKQVDAFELKLNTDCENILALFNPLANDLRLVLAVMRINYDLERIGDYARSIARMVSDAEKHVDEDILKKTQVFEMFDIAINMLTIAIESFEKEDNSNIRKIFKKDESLDRVNRYANEIVAKLIQKKPSEIDNCLNMYTTIRRLERVGDQTKNIAEEIIFYLEAKVLRHKKKKEKIEELAPKPPKGA
jgi:phosphate transport system protein